MRGDAETPSRVSSRARPISRNVVALACGRELQRMRIDAGLTPNQAAKLVGCGPRHINAHERGEHAPRIDVLINYVRAYQGSLVSIERAVERAVAGQQP